MRRMVAIVTGVVLVVGTVLWAGVAWGDDQAPGGGAAKSDTSAKPATSAAKAEAVKTEAPKGEARLPIQIMYEKKLASVEKMQEGSQAMLDKLPEAETKVHAEVLKLVDSQGKAVDTKTMRDELKAKGPSANATKFHNMYMELASYEMKIVRKLHEAYAASGELLKADPKDEDLKTKGEALAAKAKEQYIAALLRVAGVYDRVAEQSLEDEVYRSVLAVDKSDATAIAYFKQREAEKAVPGKASSGSGTYSGTKKH